MLHQNNWTVCYKIFKNAILPIRTRIKLVFTDKNNKEAVVYGEPGDNMMRLAHKNGLDIEGACAGSLACTTCHVYIEEKCYKNIPEASEREDDLLDTAPFLKANSRLSCEIYLDKHMEKYDEIKIKLPSATKNFYVDGKKPTPH
ncbi:2Fe-2S ferredoxin [Intoshia linei]|uniref:2Fe-2S ferredoxin n=1 Tax=Intoshia linei TaxID=1819745 RepID=A0A177BBA3_9BILA|nr:2Fe-2S ferredoxin [Intoshia linei]